MRANIMFDENGYANKFVQSFDGKYEVPAKFNIDYLRCYHLVDNILTLDEEKVKKEDSDREKAIEIASLKKNLTDSDYVIARTFEEIMSLDNALTFIADFIKILKSYKTQYSELISQRKAWRDRIEELSK